MTAVRTRERIGNADVVALRTPAAIAAAAALTGIRIYDVGQGDALAVLNENMQPVLNIDYGGRQDHPFRSMSATQVDRLMPVAANGLVMMTHWDEDHWSTAPKGSKAMAADWLIPRQVTSPRAVRFSAKLAKGRCIPETSVGAIMAFSAANGDRVLWQKIGRSATGPGQSEDCNRTGVALALVRTEGRKHQAILLPGDAPFGKVPLYCGLRHSGFTLTGVVAFHHGAGTHWCRSTRDLLRSWPATDGWPTDVIFSCAKDNSYGHPDTARYAGLRPIAGRTTFEMRKAGLRFADIQFR